MWVSKNSFTSDLSQIQPVSWCLDLSHAVPTDSLSEPLWETRGGEEWRKGGDPLQGP